MRLSLFAALLPAGLFLAQAVESQVVPPAVPSLSYADTADLAVNAPIVAQVRVRGAEALDPRDAPDLAPGTRRFLVEGEVVALIRGDGGLPQRVSWLIDLPNDSRGHAARLRRNDQLLVFARPVPNHPDEVRLIAPDAQLPFSTPLAERVRAILREASTASPPPQLIGIGRAFHVAGTLPGESETQIFLQTADDRPISLSVLRRPGQQPRWAVALSEIVDDAAGPPAPDTLLWYRLACFLPHTLPAQSLSEASDEEAAAIRGDYALVIQGLGACVRTRTRH